MNDLISIIIACRNATNYLKEAIDSVKNQNMNTEIIVIDDGSTDNTAEYAKSCGVTVYSIPHSGVSVARNLGLKKMNGEYAVFLDHDDVMRKGTLQRLYDELSAHPDIEYVQAKVADFISPELSEADKKTLIPRAKPYGGLLTGAFLFKKSALEKIGGFKEDLIAGQVVDFLIRVDQSGLKTIKLDFVATNRRLHNNNLGRSMPQQERKDYASILRAKLAAKK